MGIHLCNALAERGAIVQTFGHYSQMRNSLNSDVIVTLGDFSDRGALAKAVQRQDFIFHLIGGSNPGSSNRDPASEFNSGLLSTVHLLDFARAEGIRKIIFASSGGTVYGMPQSIPIAETASTNPICAYGINKLGIEKCLALYHHLYGLDYHVVRVSNPFGPLQSPFKKQGVVATFIHRALLDEPLEIWGTGEVIRDFIYVSDVIEAFIETAVYSGPHRVMNVGSGVGLSISCVARDVEKVLDKGRLAITHKPGESADVPANVLDIALITRETKWRPRISWIDGLRETIEWMERQGVRFPRSSTRSEPWAASGDHDK